MLNLWKEKLTQAELEEYEAARVAVFEGIQNMQAEWCWEQKCKLNLFSIINNREEFEIIFELLLYVNHPESKRFYELCKKAYGEDVVVNRDLITFDIDKLWKMAEEKHEDPEEMITRKNA